MGFFLELLAVPYGATGQDPDCDVLDKWLLMRYNAFVVDTRVSWAGLSTVPPQPGQAAKSANSFRIRTSKSKGLKVPYNQHLQKNPGGGGILLTSRLRGGPQV
jgi:hypothetical protein